MDSNHDEEISIISPKKHPWAFPLLAAVLSAIGGLLFGYDTGVISGAMIQLRQQFALSNFFQELIVCSTEIFLPDIEHLFQVSITLVTAAIAALFSGSLSDCAGRKPVVIVASVIFTVGAVVLGVANSKEVLLVGRLIVGFGIGMASMVVPIYIAEVAPSHIRGSLVTLNQLCITLGQFIAAVVDGAFISDSKNGWRYMLSLGGVPSIIQFVSFLAMPETPRWYVHHDRIGDARKVIMRMHGVKQSTEAVEEDLQLIMASTASERQKMGHEMTSSLPQEEPVQSGQYQSLDEKAEETNSRESLSMDPSPGLKKNCSCFDRLPIVRMLRYAPTRRSLFIGCTLQMFQQLVGINTVMYYSASIISMAGLGSSSDEKSRDSTVVWMSAVVAAVNFCGSMFGMWLISRLRRRTLLMWSVTGVFLSLVLLGASFQVIASTSDSVTMVEPLPPGFKASDCPLASTCDSCMRTSMCGFCYTLEADGKVMDGSCVPAPERFADQSTYGRCANRTTNTAMWAFDHCPTPYGWITVVGLCLYLISFAPGLASLPWTINSEIYPTWARSTGVSYATGTNWIANLFVSLTFLSLTEAITRQGTYFLYAGIALLALLFVYFFVPETGDVPLEEISDNMHQQITEDRI